MNTLRKFRPSPFEGNPSILMSIRKVPRPNSVPAKVKSTFEQTCAAIEPALGGILLHAKDGTLRLFLLELIIN